MTLNKQSTSTRSTNLGFTILELVVVIAIIVILGLSLALLLRPDQMVARARDATRVSDLGALIDAIDFANVDGPEIELGGADPDGTYTNTCSGELFQTVYVSVPNSESPPVPTDLPTGWVYKQVTEANLQNINGSGWLPVNMTGGSSTPPISALPIDPDNTFANGFYYSYVCDRAGGFELTGRMASDERRTGGSGDLQTSDGGDDKFAYEVGGDLSLNPKAPVGYWSFEDGSGIIAIDSSSYGNNGTLVGDPQWETANCISGTCLDFDGVTDRINVLDSSSLDITGNAITLIAWFKPNVDVDGMFGSGWPSLIRKRPYQVGGYMAHFFDNNDANDGLVNMQYCWSGSCLSTPSTTLFLANNWYHYAGSLEATASHIYINGVQEGQNVLASQMASSAGTDFQISGEFNGIIDEVGIYNRTMTPTEIAYQYEALKP